MKKLALVLALGVVGLNGAQAAEYSLSSGRLLFHGGLTVSGCDLTSSVGKPGGPGNGDIDIYMPNQMSINYLKELQGSTGSDFDALPSQAKYSDSIGGAANGFTMNIECPASDLAAAIDDELNLSGSTAVGGASYDLNTFIASLNDKGVLKLSSGNGAGEGGFVENGKGVGLLAPATTSVASGVGIAFLRKDGPDSGTTGKVVDFVPNTDAVQRLTWNAATNPAFGGGVDNTVTAKATYDFAYTPIGAAQALNVGSGELYHIVSFRFVYDSSL